ILLSMFCLAKKTFTRCILADIRPSAGFSFNNNTPKLRSVTAPSSDSSTPFQSNYSSKVDK
ncbi:hypothetical protein CDAR_509841, partial [Caerostris darwini]